VQPGREAEVVLPSEATTAASPKHCGGVLARTDDRRPDGKFAVGNRCSRRHGRRSAAAVERRKAGAVARKVAATILVQLGLLPAYRCRPRRLRADQLHHLDPVGLELLRRLGVPGIGDTAP
jgi:hypothetical protein